MPKRGFHDQLREYNESVSLPVLKPKEAVPDIVVWPTRENVPAFFGAIELGRDGLPSARWLERALRSFSLPYPMRLVFNKQCTVTKSLAHRYVTRSLSAILAEIYSAYGRDLKAIGADGLDILGKVYQFGWNKGLELNLHSYGIAIELNPAQRAPGSVVAIFQRHGWHWNGLDTFEAITA